MCHLLWCSSITKSLNGFHRPFTGTATEAVLCSCSAAHASALSHSNLDIWFCKRLMNLPYSPHLHLQCSDWMINLHQLLKAHPGALTPRPIRAPTGAQCHTLQWPMLLQESKIKDFPGVWEVTFQTTVWSGFFSCQCGRLKHWGTAAKKGFYMSRNTNSWLILLAHVILDAF